MAPNQIIDLIMLQEEDENKNDVLRVLSRQNSQPIISEGYFKESSINDDIRETLYTEKSPIEQNKSNLVSMDQSMLQNSPLETCE